jgi:D-alanyl-D-alanine dipeptidase
MPPNGLFMILVPIAPPGFDVDLDIAYATPNNFTGRPIYGRADCWLHSDAAACFAIAIKLAAQQGLRFRVFDAFRPQEAQRRLWAHTPDPDFLADPARGSPHSRGVAIDLTLIDNKGIALDMGTGFDAFTPLSHHGNTDVGPAAQANRHLLLGLMSTAGFDFYAKEWWHYQLFQARDRYPLISDTALPQPMMASL